MDAALRNRILDAAITELLRVGLDGFSIAGLARAAELDPDEILAHWPDRRVLLMDALITRAAESVPIPDTGSLRGDLQVLVDSSIVLVETPQGRKWIHRLLPNGRDADLSGIAADFWNFRFNNALPILERAAQRGELRDGIDHGDVIRMLSASVIFDAIFLDSPSRPEYVAQTLDIVVRGITR